MTYEIWSETLLHLYKLIAFSEAEQANYISSMIFVCNKSDSLADEFSVNRLWGHFGWKLISNRPFGNTSRKLMYCGGVLFCGEKHESTLQGQQLVVRLKVHWWK